MKRSDLTGGVTVVAVIGLLAYILTNSHQSALPSGMYKHPAGYYFTDADPYLVELHARSGESPESLIAENLADSSPQALVASRDNAKLD